MGWFGVVGRLEESPKRLERLGEGEGGFEMGMSSEGGMVKMCESDESMT